MENNNNNSFKDILYIKNPFSEENNLLDNFIFINYKRMLTPRIIFDSYNSVGLKQIIESSLEDTDFYETNNNKDISSNDDIIIEIPNEERDKRKLVINNKEKQIENSNFRFMEEKKDTHNYDIIKENLKYIKLLFNNKNDFEPVPPKGIISAFSNDNLSYYEINEIILNNIDLLSRYNSIYNIVKKDTNTNSVLSNSNESIIFKNTSSLFEKNMNNSITNSSSLRNLFESNNLLKPLFETTLNKKSTSTKRGRKSDLNRNTKKHSATDEDNLTRKIQVHYLSFIINFVNDVIKSMINMKNPPLFKFLAYEIKKNVNSKYVYELKSKNISDILQLKVSPKIKIHDESANEKIYQKVIDMCPFLNDFFQQNYLKFFKDYYCRNNTIFEVNGKTIQISSRTKSFIDLIKKYDKYKNNLKYIAAKYSMNAYKKKDNNIFSTKNINK
jgi:hypothetical protein